MNNQDKPSAKLDGFAPPTGPGVSSSRPASSSAGGTSTAAHAAAAAPSSKKPAASSVAATSTETKRTKKRGPKKTAGASAVGAAAAASTADNDNDTEEKELRPLSEIGSLFEPITLPQIQLRLKNLLEKLPKEKPEIPGNFNASSTSADDSNAAVYAPIKSFASTLQIAIEEYNLLLSLVSSATYKWGVDRSGASQQNLSVMSAELQTCQEIISNVVSARLSNVLCPAVDVLIGEIEIRRGEGIDDDGGSSSGEADGKAAAAAPTPAKKRKLNEDRLSTTKATNNERRINHYTRPLVDPSYVHLCHCILARNAPLILHTVATSIHTAQRVIGDYLNAMKKDSSHEASKGGYY